MAPDQRAFRRMAECSMLAAGVVALVGLLLGPIGGVAHLSGLLSAACLALPHLPSDVAALVLVVLVLASMGGVVASIALMVAVSRRMRAVERRSAAAGLQARAERVAASLAITAPVTVVDLDELRAWTSGMLGPRIYVSSAAMEELADDRQLGAVLLHEEHHCRRRDPLRLFVAAVLERSLFAFPVVARAVVEFRRSTEFAADDRARAAVGAVATARAILRFAHEPARPMLAQVNGARVAERVERLLGSDPQPPPPVRASLVASAVVAGASLGCLAVLALLPAM